MGRLLYKETPPFRSNEEVYASWWFEELKEAGYIKKLEYETVCLQITEPVKRFEEKQLKTKVKIVEKHVISGVSYTPDFVVEWNDRSKLFGVLPFCQESVFFNTNTHNIYQSLIEVKPKYDQNNMTREFKVKQKFIMDKLNIFVNLFIPEVIFAKTFTPKRYLLCDFTSGKRTIKFETRTMEEYFNGSS